ncbi:MAG: pyrroline-5-carboxylate reductase [Holophaga sp.]|nr:pyrroline-5-carboxylate reductase [Holophaga sp.]
MEVETTLPIIAIMGFGTMGKALAGGLLKSGLASRDTLRVGVRRAHPQGGNAKDDGMGLATMLNVEAARTADTLVLCVKPRDIEALMAQLRESGALDHHPLVISIAAGLSTANLAPLAPGCPVVRAMPNTPCAIGRGVTVLTRGPGAEDGHLALARSLFTCLGAVLELEEKHMDTVTGLSGSGPAFIYMVLEAMAEGAVMRGLPRSVALELSARVAQGAAEMVLATGRHPAALRDDVTTPAGCTVAGLLVLEDGRLRSVVARGVEMAAKVAGELSK